VIRPIAAGSLDEVSSPMTLHEDDSRLPPAASSGKNRRRMPKKIAHGTDESIQITIRVGRSVLALADARVDGLSSRRGIPVARADVFREALIRGLKNLQEEDEANAPPPKRGR
jgi:hypothetical protein